MKLLVVISFKGYAQSNINMINSSITTPLKIGKNPSTIFEKLVIEPTNLFIQSKPINNNSPHFQLELILFENNTKYTCFLWRYSTTNHEIDHEETNRLTGIFEREIINKLGNTNISH